MTKKAWAKIAIASALCAPSCIVERGVVVERQELSDEKALYINLIKPKKQKKTAEDTYVFNPGEYVADRKLFFLDSTYLEPFVYALPGDTVSFYNPFHKTYVDISKRNRIRGINGVRERDIVRDMRPLIEQYQEWLQHKR